MQDCTKVRRASKMRQLAQTCYCAELEGSNPIHQLHEAVKGSIDIWHWIRRQGRIQPFKVFKCQLKKGGCFQEGM